MSPLTHRIDQPVTVLGGAMEVSFLFSDKVIGVPPSDIVPLCPFVFARINL